MLGVLVRRKYCTKNHVWLNYSKVYESSFEIFMNRTCHVICHMYSTTCSNAFEPNIQSTLFKICGTSVKFMINGYKYSDRLLVQFYG